MFRKMRRWKQQLTDEECMALLKNEPRGVLGLLGDDAYPYTVPMDFIYDEAAHKLYFHSAKEGHKMDALSKHGKASFCVYDKGYRKDGHWSLNIRSVIVFGRIAVVVDQEKALEKLRALAEKYYPDAESIEKEIAAAGSRAACLEFSIDHMTGKLVNES